MFEACSSCGFFGLSGLGDPSSEFEPLNNAIVAASMRGGQWYKLASDWQDEVVEERNWKILIPPLWSSTLEKFWTQYAQLYRTDPNASSLTSPYGIAPSGISGAVKEFFAPTRDTAKNIQASIDAKIQTLKTAAESRVQAALKAAGQVAAKGAVEQTKKEAVNWLALWFSVLALGAAGYIAFRKRAF